MRVMILGASGYLGKKIKQCLETAGYDVTGVYRVLPTDVDTNRKKCIQADIAEIRAELQEKNYDWIINCAGVYERKGITLHEVMEANLIFAARVLDCGAECGVRNFLTIDTGLPENINFYSFTKKKFAEFGKFYAEKYGITFVNILLQMFYGEDEPGDRFLVGCCRKMLRGEEILLTEGTQKRDIIYIGDVCNAIKLLLETPLTGFYNVPLGSGEGIPVRKLMEYMYEVTKSKSPLKFGAVPARENEPDCVADMEILTGFGFVIQYPWKQGIEYLCYKLGANERNE